MSVERTTPRVGGVTVALVGKFEAGVMEVGNE
jgi:hypothetical protein